MVLEAERNGCLARSWSSPPRCPSRTRGSGRPTSSRRPTRRTPASPTTSSDFLAYLNLWRYLQRAAAGAVLQPVPPDVPRRVPQLPAGAGVAGPLQPAAPGRASAGAPPSSRRDAGRYAGRSTSRCSPGCCPTSGCKDARRAGVPGRPRRPVRDLPGLGAVQEAAALGDGRRAGGDVPPVGAGSSRRIEPGVGRAAGRAPGEAQLQRAALGRASAARCMAYERVTLYGCRSSPRRTVGYGRIDPALSRELFIRHALVEGDWETHHRFFAENQRLLAGGRGAGAPGPPARHPGRRRDASSSSTTRGMPAEVVSGAALRRAGGRRPAASTPGPAHLHARAAGQRRTRRGRRGRASRTSWQHGERPLPLRYRFEPGRRRTTGSPWTSRCRAQPARTGRASTGRCPGCREELVIALIRSLPKALRRNFVPVPGLRRARCWPASPARRGAAAGRGRAASCAG